VLHHLLTESVARSPESEAVRFSGRALTYGELDALSNQVARTLQAVGVRRGDRVGIYVHKSMSSIISVFGIMKAGAIYVPFDAKAPASRLAYVTRDCDIKVILTSGRMNGLSGLLAEETPLTTLVLLDDQVQTDLPDRVRLVPWSETRQQDRAIVPRAGAIETDLAYILYTSGSTGKPKGVMISHRAIVTFVNWCIETFRMTDADRVTSHAPLHFDLSTFDIYATLKAGGTVVLVPETLAMFPVQVADLLQDEGITVTYLVPSALSLMVTYGGLDTRDLSALRTVLFAGEVFPINHLRRLMQTIPHATFYNLYGPTETNVCTYHEVRPIDVAPGRNEPVPIGVACEHSEVFVVDDQQRLVTKPGQKGELWVRGPCVAQGYWDDPEKTASSFVRNPFQTHYSDIAYRTGDIVRLAQDGVNWLFVGREDHMVKSRGYRVELGEIEAALYSHHAVKEAVAVAIPDPLVGSLIKAFVVPVVGAELTREHLEVYCSRVLPGYMLPETIEFRDNLPRTSTGKIDRPLLARPT
jgi:amino acid adenylation domain-containing protein